MQIACPQQVDSLFDGICTKFCTADRAGVQVNDMGLSCNKTHFKTSIENENLKKPHYAAELFAVDRRSVRQIEKLPKIMFS